MRSRPSLRRGVGAGDQARLPKSLVAKSASPLYIERIAALSHPITGFAQIFSVIAAFASEFLNASGFLPEKRPAHHAKIAERIFFKIGNGLLERLITLVFERLTKLIYLGPVGMG
jgi:hypothetical protein